MMDDEGKQRSKKESEQNTNRPNPGGHERKILTKLMNAEKNNQAAAAASSSSKWTLCNNDNDDNDVMIMMSWFIDQNDKL